MFSRISVHLITNLLIVNGILILCFLWINYHYYTILEHLELLSVTSRSLNEKQKKILKKYFPFYNKLSHRLQRLFEQKLLFFYYMKQYAGVEGAEVHDRMKLLVSAYAAQVSLGFKDYGFSHINRVKIYPFQFYSLKKRVLVSWELDEEGTLHLSWKDFFRQVREEIVRPIGLEIMAFAIKKDKSTIKEDIYHNRGLLFHQMPSSDTGGSLSALFRDEDFRSKEDFLEACITNYFSHPTELKNNHPDLFRKLDKLLYSEVSLG